MAKEKSTKEKKVEKKETKAKVVFKAPLVSPRVTEKASMLSEANVYTFNVQKGATKNEVAKAIFATFKVKPVRVNVVTIKSKKVRFRGKEGVRGGGRKALVYLKKGDKIEL